MKSSNSITRISAGLGYVLAFAAFTLTACDKAPSWLTGQDNKIVLKSDDQKTLYALGLIVGNNLAPFSLSEKDLKIVINGMRDSVNKKKPVVELEKYGPKVQMLAQARMSKQADKEKESSKAFLAKAEKEPGAVKLPSGLVFKSLKAGTGASPKASDKVKVHYHGTLTDGTVFDSSVKRGEPVEFPLNGVIPCWTEGVQKMKVGEKAKLVCPSEIAYGAQGRPPTIPGGATLVFEVELLGVQAPEATAQPNLPK